MSRILSIFFLFTTMTMGQVLNAEESILEEPSAQNAYQVHLPPQIFDYVVKNDLVDLARDQTTTEKESPTGLDRLTIFIETQEEQEYVTISFSPEKITPEDNFGGLMLGYQNGKVAGYVLFDAEGRDYIVPTPLSEEAEKMAQQAILLLMEGGLQKFKEEVKAPESNG